MSHRAWALLLLLAAACVRTAPYLDSDSAPDAGQPDAAEPGAADASASCPATTPWKIEPRTIDLVSFIDSASASRMESADRFVVKVRLQTTCEVLARVSVGVMPGDATDFVSLAATAWVQQNMRCGPATEPVEARVTLPGSISGNPQVSVGAQGSSQVLLQYERSTCVDCDCYWQKPPGTAKRGEACASDCSCEKGLSCLASSDNHWQCELPCDTGTDCASQGYSCGQVPAGPAWVCVDQTGCRHDGCPAGFACEGGGAAKCVDHRPPSTGKSCDCDAQCAAGQRCITGWRDTPTCEITCASDRDCPAVGYLVCGTASICVPLEH